MCRGACRICEEQEDRKTGHCPAGRTDMETRSGGGVFEIRTGYGDKGGMAHHFPLDPSVEKVLSAVLPRLKQEMEK